jgi:ABC-type antimicrobial peptide transport system permease subunit
MLLAGQRLRTDPWNGSRTLAALLVTVVAGGITLGLWQNMATEMRGHELFNAAHPGEGGGLGADPEFYFTAFRFVMIVVGLSATVAAAGMLVALVESIVSRRRSYAALTASGVPRRTLAASVLWQTLTPLIPALVLALVSGVALTRFTGTELRVETTVLRVPIPFQGLGLLGGGALLAVLLAAGAGLLVLRSSTDLEELRV